MKIAVLVKTVPKKGVGKFKDDFTISRNEIDSVVNPYDIHAIEEALRIRDKNGGTVTVISLGSEKTKECLKYCLSLGVDEVILIKDDCYKGSDTYATAFILKTYFEKNKEYDLILCGRASADGSTAQVPAEIAAFLGIEFSTNITKCDCENGYVQCEAEYDTDTISRNHSYPVLLSVSKEINVPRIPTVDGILSSRNKTVTMIGNKELEIDEGLCGAKGSRTKVIKVMRMNNQLKRTKVIYQNKNDLNEHFSKKMELVEAVKGNDHHEKLRFGKIHDENVIVVICEAEGNGFSKESMDAVNVACGLAHKWDARLITVTYQDKIGDFDDLMEQLSKKGVHKNYVIQVEDKKLVEVSKIANRIIDILQLENAKIVLLAGTIRGRELAPYIAAKTCSGLTADCTKLDIQGGKLIQIRPAFGGEVYAVIESMNSVYEMATLKPNAFCRAYEVEGINTINIIVPQIIECRKGWKCKESKKQVSLEQRVVFGIGKGVRKKEHIEIIKQYCEKKQYGLCGTREIVDQGYLSYEHQVGLTGKFISPDIYVAIGISGALEHVVGILNSGRIISVNQKETEPISKISDYFYKNSTEDFIQYLMEEMKE